MVNTDDSRVYWSSAEVFGIPALVLAPDQAAPLVGCMLGLATGALGEPAGRFVASRAALNAGQLGLSLGLAGLALEALWPAAGTGLAAQGLVAVSIAAVAHLALNAALMTAAVAVVFSSEQAKRVPVMAALTGPRSVGLATAAA